MCLFVGNPNIRRPAVTRRHGSAGRYRAGTVCSIAWSSTVSRQAVVADQTGTVCSAAGTRRLAGPGAVPRPGSAGPGGHSVLVAGSASTRRQNTSLCLSSSASATGTARRLARDWARPTLSSNVVALGSSQSPGPAGPARRSGEGQRASLLAGPADWPAGRIFNNYMNISFFSNLIFQMLTSANWGLHTSAHCAHLTAAW